MLKEKKNLRLCDKMKYNKKKKRKIIFFNKHDIFECFFFNAYFVKVFFILLLEVHLNFKYDHKSEYNVQVSRWRQIHSKGVTKVTLFFLKSGVGLP